MKKICIVVIYLIKLVVNIVLVPIAFISCIISRFINQSIDIGIGPTPLINNIYWKRALEKKGYKVETYVNDLYFITNKFDFICSTGWRRIYIIFPILLLIRTVFRYKCLYVYFNGGPLQTTLLLWRIEPILYRIADIKLVVMPYGSDCQLFERSQNLMVKNALCRDYPSYFRVYHKKISQQVENWSRYSDIVIGTMDSVDYMHYWNRVRHCHYAIDIEGIEPYYFEPHETIRIIHAPNHKCIKGTEYIEKAIKELQNEGYNIDYVFIQGMPNDQFIQEIQRADIVIDQLIMGWYAMFAMEAMTCGKPTICYLREDLVSFFENIGCIDKDEIPLVNASTSTIKDVIRELLDDTSKFAMIGKKSRTFIEKYHTLESVGSFFDQINISLGIMPSVKE